jgi:hypothetical protein
MKYLKIFEEYSKGTRTKEITLEQAAELYKKHCFNWDLNKDLIYRGTWSSYPVFYGHAGSNEHEMRYSANSTNIYTSLTAINPSWKDAPKRHKSFIMTSDEGIAQSYGDEEAHIMIPYNGTKIGVCPTGDIWEVDLQHIPYDEDYTKHNPYNFEEFDNELSNFFKTNLKNNKDLATKDEFTNFRGEKTLRVFLVEINPNTIKRFCDAIDEIPKDKLNLTWSYSYDYNKPRKYKLISEWLKTDMKLYDYLQKILNFDDNAFDIIYNQREYGMVLNRMLDNHSVELWSDGEFLGISEDKFEEFKSMISS